MVRLCFLIGLCFLLGACNGSKSERYFKSGLAKYNLHKNKEAIIEYNKAIAIDSTVAKFYLYRGLAERDPYSGPGPSVCDFNKAIALDPKYERAYMERALIAMFDDGKYEQKDEALNNLKKVIELNPKNDSVYYWLGRIKSAEPGSEEAIKAFDIYLLTHPKSYDGYFWRAKAKEFHNPNGAIADYTVAISIKPKDPRAYLNRGTVKHLNNDQKGGYDDWRKAGELGDSTGYAFIKYN